MRRYLITSADLSRAWGVSTEFCCNILHSHRLPYTVIGQAMYIGHRAAQYLLQETGRESILTYSDLVTFVKPEDPLVKRRDHCLAEVKMQMPDSPESMLCFGVFQQALRDLSVKHHDYSARKYLETDLLHLSIFGVDPDWVKDLIKAYYIT